MEPILEFFWKTFQDFLSDSVLERVCNCLEQLKSFFRFPRYANEVKCKEEKRCLNGEGVCKQNTRLVYFLKKTTKCQKVTQKDGGHVLLEQWKLVEQKIGISCECQLLQVSKLKNMVIRNTSG